MKVRTLQDLRGTERDVKFNAGQSIRMILDSDNMGFSFHITEMRASDKFFHWHYKNHLESCYCIKGKGLLKNLTTGEIFDIVPGTIYILDNHDNHEFKPIEDTTLISVFNPPCKGEEVHQEDGSYS